MEFKGAVQAIGVLFCVLLFISEIHSLPPYSNEDYDQGIREMMEEIQRQGLAGPVVPRSYNPNNAMMRKSQRSNNLRLRFGKRSAPAYEPAGVEDWHKLMVNAHKSTE